MNENDNLNMQLFKHMKYNFLAFAIIFIVFGIFVFFMVSDITYSSVDEELINASNEFKVIEINPYKFNSFLYKPEIFSKNENNIELPSKNENNYDDNESNKLEEGDTVFEIYRNNGYLSRDYILAQKIKNPKITYILRDENFNIINIDDLGKNYDNFGSYITFNKNNLNKIYEMNIDGNYYYRGINLKIESDSSNKERYVQLFINIDSEKKLIDSYFQIIGCSVLFGIAISLLASFCLSKTTLFPIKKTIDSQREFVENVSHELRTPLTIIQAQQELLLQEPNSKIIDKSEQISISLEETKRLTKLTKDLLLLSRADTKKMIINKEEVELDEFIQNIVKPYFELATLQDKKINLKLNCNNIISIDTNKIHQVMVILLDNSLKYTEAGDYIEIDSYLKDNKVIIDVKDTGIGISDEGIKRVFDRFYREDKARNRETGGSGLGLAIAHSIIKAHNGTIKASHNNPKGTVFIIRLPR